MSGGIDGLETVLAAETILSDVDGERGRLVIRGHLIDDLAGRWTFEETVGLLWEGFFPNLPADLAARLGEARVAVFAEVAALDAGLIARSPVEATRAMIARIADGDDLDVALRLVSAPAVFTAAHLRLRAGEAAVAPDPGAGHASDILRMTRGAAASDAEVATLDAYLTTVCDHGLNASTFAARVVASTRAGLTSAVIAGLSALKGPLHGGAPGPVIEMLDGVGKAANAEAWLEAALDRGDRLMGFGHRVYRVRDPRADALKRAVHALARSSALAPGRLDLAEQVETAALAILARRKPDRSLQTNVELYTALLLEALAFPPDAFTCVFAMGRVAGWIAHAREQLAGGRLVRPQSRYVGPDPLERAA
jgi:citrate synthase